MGNGSSTATPKPAGRAGPARATTAEDPSPGLIQPLQSQHSRRVVSVRPLQQPSGVRSQQEQKPILGRLPESDPVALRLAVSSTLSGQDHSSQSAGIGPDSVFAEALRHATFCRAVAEKCSDRDDAVKLIYSFVTTWSCGNTGVETLYLGGLSGSGKSVVLSKAICDASSHLTALTASILLRHVGLTQESSDPLLLVASLCLQQNVFPLPTCRSQIPKALANLLSSASEDKPILMVLDGVDSFWDPSNSTLSWLIPALESVRGNPFVRVVLTGRDSNGSPAEIALRRSLDSLQCVSLRPLTVCEEVQAGQAFAILRKLLSAASSGSLSEDLAESVHTAFKLAKSSFVGVTPLYIRLVLEAFLLPNAYQQNMKGTKSRPATASSMPLVSTIPATTQECVDWCLTLMEGSCGTDRENDVISILTAITASRDGLSLQQLSRVLSTSDSVSVNTLLGAIQSVPGGFLVQPATGTDLFKWAHSLAREIAEYRYMGCLKPSDRLVGPISELMDKRQRQKSALSKSVDTLVNGAENHLSDLLSAGTLLGNCVQRSNPSELLRSMALSRRWDELTNLVKDIDFVISLCKSVGGWENVARELMVIGLTVESTCPPASEADSSGTNCAEWLSAAADVFHEKQSLLDVAAAADATLVKSVLMQELEKEIDGSKRIQVIQEYVKGAKANSAKIMFICDETENPRSEVVCARPEYLVLAGTLDSSCDILATALDGSTVAVVVNGIEIRVFRGHDLRGERR
ncbi:hypothetical protein DFJ73DRAFT_831778 [Zopfochytrium polystomum]|nr:hypothetical protein DFJ73DRAFT_831778 [Zopfochytrium polystomum]